MRSVQETSRCSGSMQPQVCEASSKHHPSHGSHSIETEEFIVESAKAAKLSHQKGEKIFFKDVAEQVKKGESLDYLKVV